MSLGSSCWRRGLRALCAYRGTFSILLGIISSTARYPDLKNEEGQSLSLTDIESPNIEYQISCGNSTPNIVFSQDP